AMAYTRRRRDRSPRAHASPPPTCFRSETRSTRDPTRGAVPRSPPPRAPMGPLPRERSARSRGRSAAPSLTFPNGDAPTGRPSELQSRCRPEERSSRGTFPPIVTPHSVLLPLHLVEASEDDLAPAI